MGNVIGSNVFNLCGALGLAAAVAPLPIDRDLGMLEVSALVLSAVLLLVLAQRDEAGRPWGAALLARYALFVVVLAGSG